MALLRSAGADRRRLGALAGDEPREPGSRYRFTRALRLAVDVFNVLDARHSDIDYFYTSRLPGEPAEGIEDLHLHPTLPRTARVSLRVGF